MIVPEQALWHQPHSLRFAQRPRRQDRRARPVRPRLYLRSPLALRDSQRCIPVHLWSRHKHRQEGPYRCRLLHQGDGACQGQGRRLGRQGAGSVSASEVLADNSLSNLLASPSLAPSKLDELKIKANILGSFVTKKAEQVKNELFEDDQTVLGKVKEEL